MVIHVDTAHWLAIAVKPFDTGDKMDVVQVTSYTLNTISVH